MEGKIHASLCRNRFFILLYHQCFHPGTWKHSRTEYGDKLRPEKRKTAFFRDICGLLCCSGTLRDICLRIISSDSGSASFTKGFMLQFVNIKIYMFGITALTGYITDYSTSLGILLLFEMIIATIGTIATITWIGLGILIKRYYLKYYRIINIILALMLSECIYSILK